jgi:DNA-binding HxlR family transcriptional regulator
MVPVALAPTRDGARSGASLSQVSSCYRAGREAVDRLLSDRLKELESEGLVVRRVYADTPVRVEYELTAKGRDLERVVDEVQRWADRWLGTPARRGAG